MLFYFAAVPPAAAGGAITLTWLTRANIPWSGAHTKYFSPFSVPLCRPFGTYSGRRFRSAARGPAPGHGKKIGGRQGAYCTTERGAGQNRQTESIPPPIPRTLHR